MLRTRFKEKILLLFTYIRRDSASATAVDPLCVSVPVFLRWLSHKMTFDVDIRLAASLGPIWLDFLKGHKSKNLKFEIIQSNCSVLSRN